MYLRANFEQEVLDEVFEISPGIEIPEGDYSFDDFGVEVNFAAHRSISGRIAYTRRRLLRRHAGTSVRQRHLDAGPAVSTNFGFNLNDIDLPDGSFITRIVTTSLDIVFSSRLSWTNLIQYDNVSEIMGVNIRLNWIPEAGREVFFVINHNLEHFERRRSIPLRVGRCGREGQLHVPLLAPAVQLRRGVR